MVKILTVRLSQYVNWEHPDVQAGFWKGRGTRDQIADIRWFILKGRELQKNIYFCFIDYAKDVDCVDHNKLWKILQEMGTPDHPTCLLRNLYAGQEATVRHETMDWFQIRKGVCQDCVLSPCLFNFYATYITWNASLGEAQAGINISARNINNLRYADDTTFMAESKEEVKSLLMKLNEESEKAGLIVNIQKTKIRASDPITTWQIDGETMETVRDFIFLGSKITVDGDHSHEIKRRLLLGRKAMTNLDSILISRNITVPTQFHLIKAMVPPVVMYGCESWTIKETEYQRIDAFKLVLEKPLESHLDWKKIQSVHPKGNQSWIFIRRTDAEVEAPIFWTPDGKSWLSIKVPDAGKDWRQEEKWVAEDEMVGWHHRLNAHAFEQTPGFGDR